MNMLVSALLFVPLLAIAMAHLIWALGRTWPIRDERLLVRTVAGFRDAQRMPPKLMSLGVAIACLAAGIVGLALADRDSGGAGLTALGVLLALVFLGRGALGYTRWWARQTPEEPFRTLDRKNYSPLCLALGLGFLVLVLMRLA